MTTRLSTVLLETELAERRDAVRALLASPLLLASRDEEAFRKVVRHKEHVGRWFQQNLGFGLRVEGEARFARLFKVPVQPAPPRPLETRRGQPFERRRYVLLCLCLAALDEARNQVTLRRVAERVAELSADDDALDTFDPVHAPERRAFVDVLLWLCDHEVLRPRDGETERYAKAAETDVLYDVNDRLVAALLAAPRPPALADSPARMAEEDYPETAEGERQRARRRALRVLLDEPVLYYDELPEAALAWLQTSRGFVYDRVEKDVGLLLEKRREGLAAIDPAGELTDLTFPDGGSTAKHAALLLAEQLAARQREAGPEESLVFSDDELEARTRALMSEYGESASWAARYLDDPDGAAKLAREAMELLAAFRLARRESGGWSVRPAIARFLPASPSSRAP